MAGYNGYSMSNNAVAAYDAGEKPLSKWTKADILEQIRAEEIELKCNIKLLKKISLAELKEIALHKTSWHHTSSRYNVTNFYSLNAEKLEYLIDTELLEIIENQNKKETKDAKEEEKLETWECSFLEWAGTRKHPTSTEIIEIGIIKGNWFYRADGSKKNVTANGFTKLKKIQ